MVERRVRFRWLPGSGRASGSRNRICDELNAIQCNLTYYKREKSQQEYGYEDEHI